MIVTTSCVVAFCNTTASTVFYLCTAYRGDELGTEDEVVESTGRLQQCDEDVVRQWRQPRHGDVRQRIRQIPFLLGTWRRPLGESSTLTIASISELDLHNFIFGPSLALLSLFLWRSTTALSITHHPVSGISFPRNFACLLIMKTYHSYLILDTSVRHFLYHHCHHPLLLCPSPPIDNIWAMMFVWR